MSERSERHLPTMIAQGREATEARRARGSTLGGLLPKSGIASVALAVAFFSARARRQQVA
jgi:hypothetical protein